MRFLLFIVCIIMLSGCRNSHKSIKNIITEQYQEVIAKASDLPDAPFQVHLENIAILPDNHDQAQFFYTTSLPRQDLIIYYEQQMERLGWQLSAQLKLHDSFLYYTKPEKFCAITIFEKSFVIYFGNK